MTATTVPRLKTATANYAVVPVWDAGRDTGKTLRYAENFEAAVRAVPRGPFGSVPGQGAGGYGRRMATDYVIRFLDLPGSRWRRVSCCCHSNAGSLYVLHDGDWLFLDDYDLADLVTPLRVETVLAVPENSGEFRLTDER